jgi:hypothetical protein
MNATSSSLLWHSPTMALLALFAISGPANNQMLFQLIDQTPASY